MDKNKGHILKNLALISQIGISMTVPILGGIWIGKLLDDLLGTELIFLIIFTIIGIGSAFVTLFKITTKGMDKE